MTVETEEQSNESDDLEKNNFVIDVEDLTLKTDLNTTSARNETFNQEDSLAKVILEYELKLSNKLNDVEDTLRHERLSLLKIKDKVSESGKSGFFIVQAQVNDFLRRKEKEQKQMVLKNKKEFVLKMLPVVDSFREARIIVPALTEKEEKMHTTFGSFLSNILNVFEKYGYKEFSADINSSLDSSKHEIVKVQETDDTNNIGKIVQCVRTGLISTDGEILRKAQVVATINKADDQLVQIEIDRDATIPKNDITNETTNEIQNNEDEDVESDDNTGYDSGDDRDDYADGHGGN